ncbi:MAG: thioredoxin domain-containing protein [Pseudomonadota bacterium]
MRFLAIALMFLLGASAAAAPAARPAAPATDWLTVIVRTPEGFRIGNPDAPVKLVEYGSRSCPTCGRFARESGALRSRYVAGGKLSFEFREFPVHPQDVAISTLGMCVTPRNFFTILDKMYAGQDAFNARAGALGDARWQQLQAMPLPQSSRAIADALGYTALLKQAGMTEARIQQCFGDIAALKAFGDRIQAAANIGVNGTPTFFLNGRRLDAVSWGQIEPELQAAGA